MAVHMRIICFLFCSVLLGDHYAAAEPPVPDDIRSKIGQPDSKLKRQNNGGEEVDLATIPVDGNSAQPGQSGNPQQPNIPGQTPFFGQGNPFFPQQPFFNNGLGFPGAQQGGFPGSQQAGFPGTQQAVFPGTQQAVFPGTQQAGFPGTQQAGFPGTQQAGFPGTQQAGFPQQGFPQGFGQTGFPQGFSQGAFPQGYPQGGFQQGFSGRNVILQNNGRQYLVQPLSANQRVVQRNGKQYLLQHLPGTSAALAAGNYNGVGGLPVLNVPNAALAGLSLGPNGQNAALTSANPGLSAANLGLSLAGLGALSGPNEENPAVNLAGLRGPSAALNAANGYAPFSPSLATSQLSPLSSNAKLTSTAPQRVIINSNGQTFEVEQFPIRSGQSPYLSRAVGGVAAQLAAQASGRQYAFHYTPLTVRNGALIPAYRRANEAGYGQYPTLPEVDSRGSRPEPIKREAKEAETKTGSS